MARGLWRFGRWRATSRRAVTTRRSAAGWSRYRRKPIRTDAWRSPAIAGVMLRRWRTRRPLADRERLFAGRRRYRLASDNHAVIAFKDDPGGLRFALRRGQSDETIGHLIAAGLLWLFGRRRESAAGIESAERFRERTVGVGPVAAEHLRAFTSNASGDIGTECGVAGSPDDPGETETVGRKFSGMDIDAPCVDRGGVDDPHARNVTVGKTQLELSANDGVVADAGFAGRHKAFEIERPGAAGRNAFIEPSIRIEGHQLLVDHDPSATRRNGMGPGSRCAQPG